MQQEDFFDKYHRNERVIYLSDGVFAIVLTLLVLDLKVPQLSDNPTAKELWLAILNIKSNLISFLISFMFVASLWFSHNQLFKLFERVDNTMLWYNNFLLLLLCFIPFPTALISKYPQNPVGITIFGAIWVVVPLLIYAIGSRAYHKKYLHKTVDINRYLQLRKVALFYAPVSAIPLAFAWSYPMLSFGFYILMMIGGIISGFTVKVLDK